MDKDLIKPKHPSVSVIMPAYNAKKYIKQAIMSVLAQDYTDFELIIVNDGSSDITEEIIKKFSDDRVKYIMQQNKGVSSARNLAIKHSKGPWLAFLDADDVWLPNTLAVFAEHFNDSDFMFGEYSYLGGPNNGKTVTDFSDLPNNKDELLKRLIQGNFIGIGGVCVKTDLVTQYFDESLNFAEDYKLWLTLLMKDIKVKKINKVVYKYRIHPESALHKNSKQNLLLAKLLLSFSEQNKYAKIRASRYYSYYVNTAISESLKNKYYRPDFSDYKKFDLNHKTKLKIYLYMKHFKLLTKVSEIISKRKSKYRMIVV